MQNKRAVGCRLPHTLEEAPREIVNDFLTMLAFEPVSKNLHVTAINVTSFPCKIQEFLIDAKVKKLLKSMPFEDQKLIRLDSILTVGALNSRNKY